MHFGVEHLRLLAGPLGEERPYEFLFECLEMLPWLRHALLLSNHAVLGGRHEFNLPLLFLELPEPDYPDLAQPNLVREGLQESGAADGRGHDDEEREGEHEGAMLGSNLKRKGEGDHPAHQSAVPQHLPLPAAERQLLLCDFVEKRQESDSEKADEGHE